MVKVFGLVCCINRRELILVKFRKKMIYHFDDKISNFITVTLILM
jgi:hypothetical protein